MGQTRGTGLAGLKGGSLRPDPIHRLVGKQPFSAADLWGIVKPYGRQIQQDDGGLIIDDNIAEKPYTDENAISCWHYDHSQDRNVKGINFMTCWYHAQGYSLPVGFSRVAKTEYYTDKKTGKGQRRSPISKNAYYGALLTAAQGNHIPFKYGLRDVWYRSADHRLFIKHDLKKDFIMPLQANRKVAWSAQAKRDGQWVRIDSLTLEAKTPQEIYLESVDFPLLLVKQVFANDAGSTGILYLVSSDLTLIFHDITTSYRKRWNVEPYQKSLQQNASLENSPTHTVTTPTNHFFASLCADIKLEWLRRATKLNQLALTTNLYIAALHSAVDTLRQFPPVQLAA